MQNFSNLGFICKLLMSVFLIKPRQSRGLALHCIVRYLLLCRRRALRQAYFAINDRASDFAKATPDKSQGKRDKPVTAKL
jgi:hypothetical protein